MCAPKPVRAPSPTSSNSTSSAYFEYTEDECQSRSPSVEKQFSFMVDIEDANEEIRGIFTDSLIECVGNDPRDERTSEEKGTSQYETPPPPRFGAVNPGIDDDVSQENSDRDESEYEEEEEEETANKAGGVFSFSPPPSLEPGSTRGARSHSADQVSEWSLPTQ